MCRYKISAWAESEALESLDGFFQLSRGINHGWRSTCNSKF